MKRNNSKKKQPIKNVQKISSFFTKSTTSISSPSLTEQKSTEKPLVQKSSIINISDSDDDFIQVTPKCIKNQPYIINNKNTEFVEQPETSAIKNGSTTKNSIVIKSGLGENSLRHESSPTNQNATSPTQIENFACKTPEGNKKRLRDSTPSPDVFPCSVNPKEQAKFNAISEYFNKLPPKRKMAKQDSISSEAHSSRSNQTVTVLNELSLKKTKSVQKTPVKRVSSVKLFNKSPKSLEKLNVQIMNSFVTVTPSKSTEKTDLGSTTSSRSVDTQRQNEKTPTKSPGDKQTVKEFLNGVKIKLDFGIGAEGEENIASDTEVQDSVFNDSWEGDFNLIENVGETLDLSKSHRCKVLHVQCLFGKSILNLQSMRDKTSGFCQVEGFWLETQMAVNDILHVVAVYDPVKSIWCVSNESGLIVYEPDFLISTTSVVGALFCKRRSVLNERYRGFEPSNRIMVMGILVHKILQEVLRNNISDAKQIELNIKRVLTEKETIWMIYESALNLNDIEEDLFKFVPRIVSFMSIYVSNPNGKEKINKEDWKGTIDRIEDIEENIWCHELGIKGKVDVSVKSGLTTMPLELKTGRATVSLEHRGQVILYIMMMSKFGYLVPSGLLLYLREGVLREIGMTEKEKRDIIILRNELTYFLTRKPKISSGNVLTYAELPPPINHHNACTKCSYNTICCAYLKFENLNLTNNLLNDLQSELLTHLEEKHLRYFVEWSALLALEGSDHIGSKQIHEIYTVEPKEREKNGQCITHVKIKDDVTEFNGLYLHVFEKSCERFNVNFQSSGIGVGNYVVVSTNYRPAIAAGFVTAMEHNSVTISLDRNLKIRYSKETFHLDTYSSSVSQTFNLTNLSLLLEESEKAKNLREIIIDKRQATFTNKLPKSLAPNGTPILRRLNKMQQRAVLKALASNDYLLIKGMPGTGKTATIVALIEVLVKLNKTVLITSHTHAAVDNVCVRLQSAGVNMLRLGKDNKIRSELHSCSEQTLTRHCKTPEELEQVYAIANVLAVTCLGSSHAVLNKRQMDVCIVDESTQVLQCSIIRALYSARKFILIGDPHQLPPVVKNRDAVARGLGESLFERLDNPASTVTLTLNYRMNRPITDMANGLTYQGELLVANEEIANANLKLPSKEQFLECFRDSSWIQYVLSEQIENSVCILDTGPIWSRFKELSDTSAGGDEMVKCKNPFETVVVVQIVEALLLAGISNKSIGIIAPYRAQVSKLSLALTEKEIEISTVDQFQGRDKDVIIYSCTKSIDVINSLAQVEFEILNDQRRLTVAITRAKHKFILIGDLCTVRQYAPFDKLLKCIPERCFLKLEDGRDGFCWDKIMSMKEN